MNNHETEKHLAKSMKLRFIAIVGAGKLAFFPQGLVLSMCPNVHGLAARVYIALMTIPATIS